MHYVLAGASGLIGTELRRSLEADGHGVTQLVRRPATGSHESQWDPPAGVVDEGVLASADVVVNLAGASIGAKRLNAAYAHTVLQSRVDTTSLLAGTLARQQAGTRLLQGSSIGIYGDGIGRKLTERSRYGNTLLSGIAAEWEKSAEVAVDAGVPVVFLRTGHVLASTGGLAKRLLPAVRFAFLKSFGNGEQWVSWISLEDEVRAIRFLAESDYVGAANLCAPGTIRNEDFIASLARAANRKPLFRVPAWAMRLVVGPAGTDLLASQRGVPGVLTRLDFEWSHPVIDSAAEWVMGRREGAQ